MRRLLELQRPDGIWVGELESNVTMTAQHLFWNHLLGLRTPDLDRRIANELMARMRDDGTWSIWFEGPADLSTSIEAYVALACAASTRARALAYIRREGGIPKARLFTKCFLALLGQWPWQRMVPIPPELVLLPPSAPFSIYNFACWARQTFVALAVAQSLRPVRDTDVDLSAIGAIAGTNAGAATAERAAPQGAARAPSDGSASVRRPTAPGAASSRRGCGGSSRSIASATASRTTTLRKRRRGLAGLHGRGRRPPPSGGLPVAGVGHGPRRARAARVRRPRRPSAARAAGEYLLGQEVTVKGDWAIRTPDLAPGGWAFEYENDLYPDIDDAAVISLALRQLDLGDDAVRRGARLARRHAVARAAAGARSTSTTRRCGSTRSRSATSARSPTSRAPT